MSPIRRCRRCHRVLKDEESIRQGIGPVCRLKDTAMQIELFDAQEEKQGVPEVEVFEEASMPPNMVAILQGGKIAGKIVMIGTPNKEKPPMLTPEPPKKTPLRIYISGPITGHADGNKPAFANMAKLITDAGHIAVNPHDLPHEHGKTWREFMDEDLKAMMTCDVVAMLPDWWPSKGATVERNLAIGLEIRVIDWVEVAALLGGS